MSNDFITYNGSTNASRVVNEFERYRSVVPKLLILCGHNNGNNGFDIYSTNAMTDVELRNDLARIGEYTCTINCNVKPSSIYYSPKKLMVPISKLPKGLLK